MNTIESLQALYVKLGGFLTDTYEDIAGGVPVSDYSIIPDMIAAVAKKATSGGGGGGNGNPIQPLLMLKNLEPQHILDFYCLNVRQDWQYYRGALDNITAEELHTQLSDMAGNSLTSRYLISIFGYREQPWLPVTWHNDDALLAAVRVEADSEYELWEQVADIILAAEPEGEFDVRINVAEQALSEYLAIDDFTNCLYQYAPLVYVSNTAVIPSGGTSITEVQSISCGETGQLFWSLYQQGVGLSLKIYFTMSDDASYTGTIIVPVGVSHREIDGSTQFTFWITLSDSAGSATLQCVCGDEDPVVFTTP